MAALGALLILLFCNGLPSPAHAQPSCPAASATQYVPASLYAVFYSPTCVAAYGGYDAFYNYYPSTGALARAISENCTGSLPSYDYGGPYGVGWGPIYACSTSSTPFCMDAVLSGGNYPPDTPFRPALSATYQCPSGNYIKYNNPPDQGQCDPCSVAKQGILASPNPIEYGSGNENLQETDYRSADGRLGFTRSFNSSDPLDSVLSQNWQDSFHGRRIASIGSAMPLPPTSVTYVPPSPTYVSNIYADPATACTSGWQDIRTSNAALTSITATYNSGNNTCQLSNGITLKVYYADTNAAYLSEGAPAGVAAVRPDGSLYPFDCTAGSCSANSDIPLRLTASSSGYTLTTEDDTVETYDLNGQLQSITSRDGYQQNMSYSGSQLSSVVDSFGRSLSFTYLTTGGSKQLSTLTTPDGVISFGYDSNRRLSSVTYPDGSSRGYAYADNLNVSSVTAITDESGNAYLSIYYDALGRAYQSGLNGGVGQASISYTDPANPVVTDALGVARTYHYTTINGRQKITSITGTASCLTCNAPASMSYDSAGYVSSTTDWNGNLTSYVYDDSRGLETSRTEAVGTPQQRTITTTWHASFRLPTEIDEPGRQTSFSYDSSGNLLTRTIKDTATSATRTWTYSSYTAWGAPQTIDGPRTDVADVTHIAYYPIVSGDAKSGQIDTITDALGHVTTVNSYDPSGRPLQITDPNGLVTVFTYTPRGWLASRQTGTELTQYNYYPTGLLQKTTLPDGRSLQYSYNAAHQLTQVQDQLGDRMVFTPDAMGNNTAVNVYDPSGTLVQTHTRVYNNLNELYQDVSAQGHATTYGYDNNGNRTSTTDPLSHQTLKTYDALDRLGTVTDPAGGVTQYAYNTLDQLTGVTDPRSLATSYTRDALDNTGTVQSPDSGTTGATYDAAGNLLTRTDAKSQTTQYQYDALNRLTLITYADSTTVSFTYDQGTNGIGRRTGMVDASGSTSWSYDAHGRLLSKVQTVGSAVFNLQYSYDSNGRMQSMTSPSAEVDYTWTSGQISALTINGDPMISAIGWQPFAGPKTWTYFNTYSRHNSYDLDGRLSATGAESEIDYDAASRITSITAPNTVSSYGYDTLDRLTSYSEILGGDPYISNTYGYDADGNRNSQSLDVIGHPAVGTSYTMDSASNRLVSIASGMGLVTPVYDANGSLTQDATGSYTYNAAGRLSGVSSSYSMSAPATYTYNGLGERVMKQVGSNSTYYVYDADEHLVGEYGWYGFLYSINSTIRLGDLPLLALNYPNELDIQADHLNTPRFLNDPTWFPVWSWDSGDFGTNAADTNASLGEFDYDVYLNDRYPGQTFDGESGLHYNLNRYYSPGTGRYLESDPIGLVGGINTYTYVRGNPISRVDLRGLCDNDDVGCLIGSDAVGMSNDPVMQALGALTSLAFPGLGAVGDVGAAARMAALERRANEVHDVLDTIAQSRRTTAVLRTKGGCKVVGSGGRDLSPAQRALLNGDEEAALAPGAHAEATVLQQAEGMGLAPDALATTRAICPECADLIEQMGGTVTSPTTATFP